MKEFTINTDSVAIELKFKLKNNENHESFNRIRTLFSLIDKDLKHGYITFIGYEFPQKGDFIKIDKSNEPSFCEGFDEAYYLLDDTSKEIYNKALYDTYLEVEYRKFNYINDDINSEIILGVIVLI